MLWDPKWQEKVTPAVKPLAVWQTAYLRAADYLEKHGWVRGTLGHDYLGPRCLIGVLQDVGVTNRDATFLLRYLGFVDGHVGYLAIWNDWLGRTKEQVVFALRDCAMNGE